MVNIIVNNQFGIRFPKEIITRTAHAFSQAMKLKHDFQISLAFVNNATIKKWNQNYRHKGITDVLSFRYLKKNVPQGLFGEIIIAIPYVEKTARKEKLSFAQMLMYLIIHGLLHIWGYDHENMKERSAMFEMERRIMNHLL